MSRAKTDAGNAYSARSWPKVGRVLGALRPLRPGDRVSALTAALAAATELETEPIATELLECAADADHPEPADIALCALLAHWDRLPRNLRRVLPSIGDGRWGDLAIAAAEIAPAQRLGFARAIDRLDARPLASLLARWVASAGDDEALAETCERGLARLASRVARDAAEARGDGALDPRDIDAPAVLSAVTDALRTLPDHKRRAVALAALLLRPGPGRALLPDPATAAATHAFEAVLRDPAHPAGVAVRGAMRHATDPAVRGRVVVLLADESFAMAALDKLRNAERVEAHAAACAQAHLMLHPARVARCRATRLASAGDALPRPDALPSMPAAARRGLPRWLDALQPPAATLETLTSPLVADPDPRVRLSAIPVVPAGDLIDFCFDAEPATARSAALRWSTVGVGAVSSPGATARRATHAKRLARSPHACVRTIGAQEAPRHEESSVSHAASRRLARRRLATEPERTVDRWRGLLRAGGEPAERIVRILIETHCAERFERELVALASETESARLAASAAVALGFVPGEAAGEAIDALLGSADPRVRSNAAQALAARHRRGMSASRVGARLDDCRDDPAHRARATVAFEAFREGLSEPKAARVGAAAATREIAAMLSDDRAPHRVAGAWAAERAARIARLGAHGLPLDSLASQLDRLAEGDPDPRVRARAARGAAAASRAVRTGWAAEHA